MKKKEPAASWRQPQGFSNWWVTTFAENKAEEPKKYHYQCTLCLHRAMEPGILSRSRESNWQLLSSGMCFQRGRANSSPQITTTSSRPSRIHSRNCHITNPGLIGISNLIPWVWIGAPAEIPGAASGLIRNTLRRKPPVCTTTGLISAPCSPMCSAPCTLFWCTVHCTVHLSWAPELAKTPGKSEMWMCTVHCTVHRRSVHRAPPGRATRTAGACTVHCTLQCTVHSLLVHRALHRAPVLGT